MTEDLDGRDFAEVRRRVVDPVVHALMAPEEVRGVTLQFGFPDEAWGADGYDHTAEVWLRLIDADDDRHWHQLGDAGDVGRWDALRVAGEFASELSDWVAESSYGWGQWREVDVNAVVLPPRWPDVPPGRRGLEMYAALDADSPIWERGVNMPLDSLPLSPQLACDLAGWQSTYLRLNANDDVVETDEDIAAWDSLEPARISLVERLRDELPAAFEVLGPLPRPPVHRSQAEHGSDLRGGTELHTRTITSGVDLVPLDEDSDGTTRGDGLPGTSGP